MSNSETQATFYLKVTLEVDKASTVRVPGQVIPWLQNYLLGYKSHPQVKVTQTEAALSPTAFLTTPAGSGQGGDAYRLGLLDGKLQTEEALILFLQEHGSGEHWVVTQGQVGDIKYYAENALNELQNAISELTGLELK